MKFGTNNYFDIKAKPIEIGYDRFIISPSPHKNVFPEYMFNVHSGNILMKFYEK